MINKVSSTHGLNPVIVEDNKINHYYLIEVLKPICIRTAYPLEGESEESLRNFDGVLTRPIWAVDLINKLLEVLDN